MAASLKRWDSINGSGGSLGDDYYFAMAFGGLYFDKNPDKYITEIVFYDEPKALINNPETEKEILQIIFNEQEGNAAAKGQKCD